MSDKKLRGYEAVAKRREEANALKNGDTEGGKGKSKKLTSPLGDQAVQEERNRRNAGTARQGEEVVSTGANGEPRSPGAADEESKKAADKDNGENKPADPEEVKEDAIPIQTPSSKEQEKALDPFPVSTSPTRTRRGS